RHLHLVFSLVWIIWNEHRRTLSRPGAHRATPGAVDCLVASAPVPQRRWANGKKRLNTPPAGAFPLAGGAVPSCWAGVPQVPFGNGPVCATGRPSASGPESTLSC